MVSIPPPPIKPPKPSSNNKGHWLACLELAIKHASTSSTYFQPKSLNDMANEFYDMMLIKTGEK